jgi:hypothetical protein
MEDVISEFYLSLKLLNFNITSQLDEVKTKYHFEYSFLTKCQIPEIISELGCEIDHEATQRKPKGDSEGTPREQRTIILTILNNSTSHNCIFILN